MVIASASIRLTSVRVVKTVFLENGVFVPYRKQVALTKNGENDDLQSTHKNKGLRSSEPKMTKMAGVPQTKPQFDKNTVFDTLIPWKGKHASEHKQKIKTPPK